MNKKFSFAFKVEGKSVIISKKTRTGINMSSLADKLIKLRREARFSQKELGALVGVSDRAVSKWECGLSRPSLEACVTLSGIFKIPLDELISGEKRGFEEEKKNGMASIRSLYRIGPGPSSSHTIAPSRAASIVMSMYPEADFFKVVLYGSLARTGYGHGTETALKKAFGDKKSEIILDYMTTDIKHPNTMDFQAYLGEKELGMKRIYSTGGGAIEAEGEEQAFEKAIYPHSTFGEIMAYLKETKKRIPDYIEEVEGKEIWSFLATVWETMKDSIDRGLSAEGILPGGLEVKRKAKTLKERKHMDETSETKENRMVCSFAYAVSEENAAGGIVVTAPTCGASGVLPAVLRYQQEKRGFSDREICRALATAALFGNLIKTNASISGAECGCQAEIGSACSMGAAALAELFDMDIEQIEYAAEVAMEHHLGLTCDPIRGLVQIPCIERNAVGAMRSIQAVNLANFLSDTRKISFDLVIQTMYETGKDMSKIYRETAEGGLAKLYQ